MTSQASGQGDRQLADPAPHDFVIVGGGPAGMSAALVAGLNRLDTVLLERSDVLGGQIRWADAAILDLLGGEAEDGHQLADRFADHLRRSPARIRTGATVEAIRRAGERVSLTLTGGETVEARRVLLASGLRHRRLGVAGEALAHLIDSPRKSLARFRGKVVGVVGGGDEASSLAHDLAEAGARVILLVRNRLRARPAFADAVASQPGVDIRSGAALAEILGSGDPATLVLTSGERLTVDFCFVRIGVEPSLPTILPPLERSRNGLLSVDPDRRTSCPLLFAAGDLVRPPAQRYIAAALADGTVVARRVEEDLSGR